MRVAVKTTEHSTSHGDVHKTQVEDGNILVVINNDGTTVLYPLAHVICWEIRP